MSQTKEIINQVFHVFLVTYLLLLLLEEVFTGIVLDYLNLNYLLIIVLIAGVLTVLFPTKEKKRKEKATGKDYLYTIFLGIAGTVIIFIKTKELGWLSYLISIIAGILIILLSFLVLEEDEKKH